MYNFRGFGIHPMHSHEFQTLDKQLIEELILNTPSCFIGEIGLDLRKNIVDKQPLVQQKECFVYFAELAYRHKKLMSIHTANRSPGFWEYLI